MGCYAERAAFSANVSAWNGNGFWTVVDGFPIPNRLVNYEPQEPVDYTPQNDMPMYDENGFDNYDFYDDDQSKF